MNEAETVRVQDTDAVDAEARTSVLFICLGNICRSPLAEGVFRALAEERGVADRFHIDSAGTGGWHVGEPPDPRSTDVAREHGIALTGSARRVEASDLDEFDYLIVMDRQNERDVGHLQELYGDSAQLQLLREYDAEAGGDLDVPDPYYGGSDGFDKVYRMVRRSCEGLLRELT